MLNITSLLEASKKLVSAPISGELSRQMPQEVIDLERDLHQITMELSDITDPNSNEFMERVKKVNQIRKKLQDLGWDPDGEYL